MLDELRLDRVEYRRHYSVLSPSEISSFTYSLIDDYYNNKLTLLKNNRLPRDFIFNTSTGIFGGLARTLRWGNTPISTHWDLVHLAYTWSSADLSDSVNTVKQKNRLFDQAFINPAENNGQVDINEISEFAGQFIKSISLARRQNITFPPSHSMRRLRSLEEQQDRNAKKLKKLQEERPGDYIIKRVTCIRENSIIFLLPLLSLLCLFPGRQKKILSVIFQNPDFQEYTTTREVLLEIANYISPDSTAALTLIDEQFQNLIDLNDAGRDRAASNESVRTTPLW